MGFAETHRPTSASTGDSSISSAYVIPSSRGDKGNLILPHVSYLSLFTTTHSVFSFHPLGHEVAVFPYRERPWFSFKFSNVSFDDHPPLAKNHGQA